LPVLRLAITATLAIPESDGSVELKAVAVDAALHGQGIGKRMLAAVLDDLRVKGVDRVIGGTSKSGIGLLALIKKAGFQLWKIERQFLARSVVVRTVRKRMAFLSVTWFGWI
jgi:GNAT superfamily N-acetyltransferase